MPTLVLIRHAKSDWSGNHSDHKRPLNKRGKRQAPEAGQWLAGWLGHDGPALDRALVSPAVRAARTWDLVAAELVAAGHRDIKVKHVDDLYTFNAHDVVDAVRRHGKDAACLAVVGHNPALEDLASGLVKQRVAMPTSCVAVIELPDPWKKFGKASGRLLAHGRPPIPESVT